MLDLRNLYVEARDVHSEDVNSFKGHYHITKNSKGELMSRYGVTKDTKDGVEVQERNEIV